MNQPQYEKNPNGGYLNKSNYGADSWYGAITITPELLAQIQQTGKALIEVKDIQTTQYGECRRIVAKPYTPAAQQSAPQQAAPVAQAYAPQAPQPAYAQPAAPAPQAPQGYAPPVQSDAPTPAPQQGAPLQQDAIPW